MTAYCSYLHFLLFPVTPYSIFILTSNCMSSFEIVWSCLLPVSLTNRTFLLWKMYVFKIVKFFFISYKCILQISTSFYFCIAFMNVWCLGLHSYILMKKLFSHQAFSLLPFSLRLTSFICYKLNWSIIEHWTMASSNYIFEFYLIQKHSRTKNQIKTT